MTPEQTELVRQVTMAYRDALNYTSQIAFEPNKLSGAARLQKLVYSSIRDYSLDLSRNQALSLIYRA